MFWSIFKQFICLQSRLIFCIKSEVRIFIVIFVITNFVKWKLSGHIHLLTAGADETGNAPCPVSSDITGLNKYEQQRTGERETIKIQMKDHNNAFVIGDDERYETNRGVENDAVICTQSRDRGTPPPTQAPLPRPRPRAFRVKLIAPKRRRVAEISPHRIM